MRFRREKESYEKIAVVSVRAGVILTLGCILGYSAMVHAQVEDLKLVPPESVPASGTFFSLQMAEEQPPLPFNPFESLPVYWLSDGLFLIDDSSVDYLVWQEQAAFQSAETSQTESAQAFSSGVGAGCGLWLSIGVSNDLTLLTLFNTRTGQTYTVSSTEDISITLTNWSVETNVTGASGDFTETIIAMGQRTNLFLRASEYRDYVTNTVFQGLSFANTGASVAHTMGAVGPSHFVELLNGEATNTAIAVYDKSGTLISQMSMSNFFAVLGADGTNYPTGDMADPRILYDHQSQRWVASAMQQAIGIVILAVSNDDSPTNLASGWAKYVFQLRTNASDDTVDYDTLGMDANGIYFSVLRAPLGTTVRHSVVAIKKPEIYQGTNLSTQLDLTNVSWTIQPAVNFDDVPTNGLLISGPIMKKLSALILFFLSLPIQGNLVFENTSMLPVAAVTISTAPGSFGPASGPTGAYIGLDSTATLLISPFGWKCAMFEMDL